MQQFRFIPYRAPISIAERLVPALGFAVATVAGGIGAILLRTLFESMKVAETASLEGVFVGLASVAAVTGSILAAAAGVGLAGILVSPGRIFLARLDRHRRASCCFSQVRSALFHQCWFFQMF